MAAECGFCAVFKDRGEAYTSAGPRVGWSRRSTTCPRIDRPTPVSQNSTACWTVAVATGLGSQSSKGYAPSAAIQPGSVDMLGPIRLDAVEPRGLGDREGPSCD